MKSSNDTGSQRKKLWRPKRGRMVAPESIGDLMGKVLERLGGENRALEQKVFGCYTATVGEMFRRQAEPDALRGTTLFLKVSSSALAHEVTMLRRDILKKMAVTLGPDAVTEIRTRIGGTGAAAPR